MDILNNLPGEKTIDKIAEERVFGVIYKEDGTLDLVEFCDEYFRVKLTKDVCEDLSAYFGELAKRLENNETTT